MRCKACDVELSEYEIIWRQELERFDELCKQCRTIVYESLTEFGDTDTINHRIPQRVVYIEDQLNTSIFIEEDEDYE